MNQPGRLSWLQLRISAIVLCVIAFSAIDHPASADASLTRRTVAGREVLVRGFAEVGDDCKLRHVQTVTTVSAPAKGRIEQRPGIVTIGDDPGSRSCAGTKLEGVQVFYVPEPGFVGTDRFSIDVEDASRRTVRATVDVEVRPAQG